MSKIKPYTAIGLMSGTSLDGIDAALLETDGLAHVRPLAFHTVPYDADLKAGLRACLGRDDITAPDIQNIERALTLKHAESVRHILDQTGYNPAQIDLIGFHGQTITHDIDRGLTVQIGDGALLAAETGIDVVNDFRKADVENGGHGAPLLPLYHQARIRADALPTPLAIVNIGGVANITYIHGDDILAFDTGPGCAMIDDFIQTRTEQLFDKNGKISKKGTPDQTILDAVCALPYFNQTPPKSLDRESFKTPPALRGAGLFQTLETLSLADGAATLTAFTMQTIALSAQHLPEQPAQWLITGGGRHNTFLMDCLRKRLAAPVYPVEHVGWNGDAVEAEGFAYLAVRSIRGEPLSLPQTTGVRVPQTGGVLHRTGFQAQQAV